MIEELRVVGLRPGDVILVRTQQDVTKDQVDQIRARLSEVFPGHQIVIMTGVGIEIVRPAPDV